MKEFLLILAIVAGLNIGFQTYLSWNAIYCSDMKSIPTKLLGFRLGCYLSNAINGVKQ